MCQYGKLSPLSGYIATDAKHTARRAAHVRLRLHKIYMANAVPRSPLITAKFNSPVAKADTLDQEMVEMDDHRRFFELKSIALGFQ